VDRAAGLTEEINEVSGCKKELNAAVNPAMIPQFAIEDQWHRVTDLERYPSPSP
jgi:hypothetical protein